MPGTLIYFAWQRSGVYSLSNGQTVDGRLQAELQLALRDRDSGEREQRSVGFRIQGPRDVEGLRAGVVRRCAPVDGDQRAEMTKYVHVELAEPDLAWRYTPELAVGDKLRPWLVLVVGEAQPREGESKAEITLLDQGRVELAASVCMAHPLAQSAAWAHIQVELAEELDLATTSATNLIAAIEASPHPPVPRLLSPRPLEPEREYIAVVVGAFEKETGADAWTGGQGVTVSAYHHFRFRTAERGDFRTLAAALDVAPPDPELGRAEVSYARVDPSVGLHIRGALAPVGAVDAPLPPAVASNTAALTTTPMRDDRGRPVLAPRVYGKGWLDDPKQQPWGRTANEDPRHRGGGGLGALGGIHEQELIVDAVREQIGPIAEVKHRVHNLVVGLSAAGSLWRRHLPADSMRRLSLFGPALGRVNTSEGTVLERMTGGTRPMPPASLSATARRVLRSGTARAHHAAAGATDPGAALRRANQCPAVEPKQAPGLPSFERMLDNPIVPDRKALPNLDEPLRRLLGNIDSLPGAPDKPDLSGGPSGGPSGGLVDLGSKPQFPRFGGRTAPTRPLSGLIGSLGKLADTTTTRPGTTTRVPGTTTLPGGPVVVDGSGTPTIDIDPQPGGRGGGELSTIVGRGLLELYVGLNGGPDEPDCDPVNLDALVPGLTTAFDPTGPNSWMRERALRDIDGLPEPALAPVEVCTSIDLLGWKLLAELAPDWLLPGVSGLERDKIYAFVTNPKFVQAFMLGLNEQALSELRWRNVPLASGCTPIRKFWGRIDPDSGKRIDDIASIGAWTKELGDADHQGGTGTAENLVLVVKGDLFRRYPDTLVYAVPAALDSNGQPAFGEQDFDPSAVDPDAIAWPVFQGRLGEDLYFFGLEIDATAARRYWLVFEEPASGLRFRSDDPPGSQGLDLADGRSFAMAHISKPTRVLIRGARFLPESR